MTVKNFLEIVDKDTRVSICSDMGPIVDAKPAGEITVHSILYHLNAPVLRIYYDKDDNSVTLEVDDNFDD